MRLVTLPSMRISKRDIGTRIAEARKAKGIESLAELCRLVLERAKSRAREHPGVDGKMKQTLTPQTVSNWEGGKVVPSWDMLPLLAEVLGTEEEWILFGSKRNEQLRKERQFLERINDEEAALLTMFREASKSGQKTILKLARDVAEDHPAPEASVHPMRRKDDKVKS